MPARDAIVGLESGGFHAGTAGVQCFHALHPSPGARTGVVFCSPLSVEKYCSARSFAEMARHFATLGIASLRFDAAGTGDSEGSSDQLSLSTQVQDTLDAVSALIASQAVAQVVLVGCRLGATVARLAAARHPAIAAVVLVDPIVDGAAYWTELLKSQQMSALTRGVPSPKLDELRQQAATTGVEIKAELFGPAFASELQALDLPRLADGFAGPQWVVSLAKAATPSQPAAAYVEAQRAAGADIRSWVDEGAVFWTEKPLYEGYLPTALYDHVGTQLQQGISR